MKKGDRVRYNQKAHDRWREVRDDVGVINNKIRGWPWLWCIKWPDGTYSSTHESWLEVMK